MCEPNTTYSGLVGQAGVAILWRNKEVTVRLSQAEVDALDQLTVGQFSRSQVMRIVLQDFLQKSEREQRKFLTSKAFD